MTSLISSYSSKTSRATDGDNMLGCAISVICYSFCPPRSDALFSNYFEEDLLYFKASVCAIRLGVFQCNIMFWMHRPRTVMSR